jgi:hypothetical protein
LSNLKNYTVTAARFIGGHMRAVGDPVSLSDVAAKYYCSPYGSGLELVKPSRVNRRAKSEDASPENQTTEEG